MLVVRCTMGCFNGIGVLLLLTLSCCSSTLLSTQKKDRTQRTTLMNRVWDSHKSFTLPHILARVDSHHKYTFILTRYGMSVPDMETFKNDPYYKDKWAKRRGGPTYRGLLMIHQLAVSLSLRYHLVARRWSSEQVTFSASERSDRAAEYLSVLHRGFFKQIVPRDTKAALVYNLDFDKGDKIKSCPYWKRLKIDLNNPRLKQDFRETCSDQLYSFLQQRVGLRTSSEWFINDPDRLYRLLTMVVFESAQHTEGLQWLGPHFNTLKGCMKDYFLSFISAENMREMLLAQMLSTMKKESEMSTLKMHIHMTDDLSFLAMAWFTQELWKTQGDVYGELQWPNYGDSLIFDFTSSNVMVTMYSPLSSAPKPRFSNTPVKHEQLFRMKSLNEVEWSALCRQQPQLHSGPNRGQVGGVVVYTSERTLESCDVEPLLNNRGWTVGVEELLVLVLSGGECSLVVMTPAQLQGYRAEHREELITAYSFNGH